MAVVYHGVWLITMLLASPAVVSQDQLGRGVKFLSWIWVWLVKVARNSLLETKLDFCTAKIASLKSGQILIPQPTVYGLVSLKNKMSDNIDSQGAVRDGAGYLVKIIRKPVTQSFSAQIEPSRPSQHVIVSV